MMAILLTVFLVPLVWSGIAFALHAAFNRNTAPDDMGEKLGLAILLTPVAAGVALAVAVRFMPIHLPVLPPVLPVAVAPVTHALPKAPAAPVLNLSDWLVPTVLALYTTGVALHGVPLALAFARLRRVVNLARPREVAGEAVYVTAGDVPPLAWGRDMILLPESLTQRLGHEELAMVIRHEREHLHRGDAHWFAVLAWIDAIFWFNPFVRLQTGRCRMAAELACDAAVTRAAPAMRQVYASLLVETLKHAAGDVRQYAPAVISTLQSGDYRMRLKEIMHAEPLARKPKPWLYAAIAAAALPLAFAQFAWSQDARQAKTISDEAVQALADGTVTQVTYTADTDPTAIVTADGKKDKTTIDIDYGDGIASQFVTEGRSSFKVGDHVTSGQKLAEDGFPMDLTVQSCWPQAQRDKPCELNISGLNGRSLDSNNGVMWGDVRAAVRGHIIHADIAFLDNVSKTVVFDNHLRIDWTPSPDAVRDVAH